MGFNKAHMQCEAPTSQQELQLTVTVGCSAAACYSHCMRHACSAVSFHRSRTEFNSTAILFMIQQVTQSAQSN
jgi:hypothetical protein